MHVRRTLGTVAAIAVAALSLAGCSTDTAPSDASSSAEAQSGYPITIEHALGETTITEKPERVATVAWANQEVPLALGVVPVGMAAATWGDDDTNGLLPWVEDKLEELGAETPVLFDETDGIDFEAVADTNPDVILASYSGLTQEDYDTLSEIAPVVAYPDGAWATSWRDVITYNSLGMGMAAEGEALIADLEEQIATAIADAPELEGLGTMFLTHVDPTDLSEVSFYTTLDTRTAFFADLGLATPASIAEASEGTESFSATISAEQVDIFDDVDIIVTYGDEELVSTLESDALLSQIPAVANGAIVSLSGSGPIGTAANPTALALPWILDDYVALLADAAAKAQ